jgi:hypothetical protein|tara:strand:- start:3824 stop:4045 length:222 start_codon:yes stop_codon:yes gene_type:complete
MMEDASKFDAFIKKANDKKYAKKKTRKQAFSEFQAYRDGKLDQDTGLPRPPLRLRGKTISRVPTTNVESQKDE